LNSDHGTPQQEADAANEVKRPFQNYRNGPRPRGACGEAPQRDFPLKSDRDLMGASPHFEMNSESDRSTGGPGSSIRLLVFAGGYAVLVALGILLSHWITAQLEMDIHLSPSTDVFWNRVVLIAFFTYVVLMTLPFVPGVEIGIALLVVFGGEMSLLVYLGTVLALALSFLIGMVVPERLIIQAFGQLRLRRAQALASRLESMSAAERLRFLLEASPARSLSLLIKFRYLTVALLLNMPGNFLIGGGGGIGMAAGMSRLFRFPYYLATVALAATPVPLMVAMADAAGW